MDMVTADFETFYDKEYSLSKITTEAYIRSSEFETIGVSIKINDGETRWYPQPQVKAALEAVDWANSALLAHNTRFDGAILAWRYGIYPKFYLDTLSMSRPVTGLTVGGSLAKLAQKFCLGEKGTEVVRAIGKRYADFTHDELAAYGSYCCNDTDLTWRLYHVLRQFSTKQELYVIDLLLRMYMHPVLEHDFDLLVKYKDELVNKKTEMLASANALCTKQQLMSNPQFAELLMSLGVDPPMKLSKTAKNKDGSAKLTYAFAKTDIEFNELLEHEDIRVQCVVAARLGVKSTIEETRTQSFIEIATRGAMPVPLNYYAGHTGRAGGSDGINLQNLSARNGRNTLRKSVKAPDGHALVAVDSAQIEARVLGWLAGQSDLTAAFAAGEDIYSNFASEIYEYPVSKHEETKTERFVGKTGILGLGFGTGDKKLKHTLKVATPSVDLPLEMCEKIVARYREKYTAITALWKSADQAIKAIAHGVTYELGVGVKLLCDGDGIHLPNGMLIRYPNLRRGADGWVYENRGVETHIYGAKLIENVVQALARIIVFWQMCKIDLNLRKYDGVRNKHFKTVLTVHDEVVACVPKESANTVLKMMLKVMSTVPAWASGLPIACEGGYGDNYAECK